MVVNFHKPDIIFQKWQRIQFKSSQLSLAGLSQKMLPNKFNVQLNQKVTSNPMF